MYIANFKGRMAELLAAHKVEQVPDKMTVPAHSLSILTEEMAMLTGGILRVTYYSRGICIDALLPIKSITRVIGDFYKTEGFVFNVEPYDHNGVKFNLVEYAESTFTVKVSYFTMATAGKGGGEKRPKLDVGVEYFRP